MSWLGPGEQTWTGPAWAAGNAAVAFSIWEGWLAAGAAPLCALLWGSHSSTDGGASLHLCRDSPACPLSACGVS